MKVKCVNIYDEFLKEFVSTNYSLTIGKDYLVIAMYINPKEDVYYRLLDNDPDGRSALFDASQFNVVSDVIPPNWRVTQNKTGTITFSPLAWKVPGFWEKFYEYDPEAKKIYEKELKIIIDEESNAASSERP